MMTRTDKAALDTRVAEGMARVADCQLKALGSEGPEALKQAAAMIMRRIADYNESLIRHTKYPGEKEIRIEHGPYRYPASGQEALDDLAAGREIRIVMGGNKYGDGPTVTVGTTAELNLRWEQDVAPWMAKQVAQPRMNTGLGLLGVAGLLACGFYDHRSF